MIELKSDHIKTGLYLGLGLAAYLLAKKLTSGEGGAMANLGSNIAKGAGNAVGGVVQEVGTWVGIPRTNAEKCEQAKAAGSKWDASLYCPATDFVPWALGTNTNQPVEIYAQSNEFEAERRRLERMNQTTTPYF